jgi:Zn/Cd-binding protein ZinT
MAGIIKRISMILIILISFHINASADAKVTLEKWQGSFLSQDAFLDSQAFDQCHAKITDFAQKAGKDYSIKEVRAFLKKVYHSDFKSMKIDGNTITFFKGEFETPISRTEYTYLGAKETAFGKKTIQWHAFQSGEKNSENSIFKNIVLLEIRPEKKAVPHFHMRYGKESPDELVEKNEFQRWWPTYLYKDFDLKKLAQSKKPGKMSMLLP